MSKENYNTFSVSSDCLLGPCNTLDSLFNGALGVMELKICSFTAETSAPVSILNSLILPLSSTYVTGSGRLGLILFLQIVQVCSP